MKISCFSTHPFDREYLEKASIGTDIVWDFLETGLNPKTAILAAGSDAVCCFVNDKPNREALVALSSVGVRGLALRSAGYNHVDLAACKELGLRVARVPAYSPHAVAEHAIALLLTLNRKLHKAYNRVREGNFALHGLMGFDLNGKTVGVVGTGKIGSIVAKILGAFGCHVLANDPLPTQKDLEYVDLPTLLRASRVVTLHPPLTPDSHHLIDREAFEMMPSGAILVNTSRGALVDTNAAIDSLKSGRLGGLAIDVYEEEENLFFRDLSDTIIQDDVFARLLSFPNVLISGHQAFFTEEALTAIAKITVENLMCLVEDRPLGANEVRFET